MDQLLTEFCFSGGQHTWLGSGRMYWFGATTTTAPTKNDPNTQEQVCTRCGVIRYVPVNKG